MQDNNIEYWQKMSGFYTPFMKNNKKMYEAIAIRKTRRLDENLKKYQMINLLF